MKRILISGLLAVLLLGSSFHFSILYLNYIRTLGMSFSPGVSLLMKTDITPDTHKDILQVNW